MRHSALGEGRVNTTPVSEDRECTCSLVDRLTLQYHEWGPISYRIVTDSEFDLYGLSCCTP